MEAVILAAGNGTRLQNAHSGSKCLVEIDGQPLIERQLRALNQAGCTRVIVVVGYDADRVRTAVGSAAECVANTIWDETNSLYSFLLARPHLEADLLVLNCDVLFPPPLLHSLAAIQSSAIAYDSTSSADEDQMSVAVENGRVVELGKLMPRERVSGENLGVVHLTRSAAADAFEAAGSVVKGGRLREWFASALNPIATDHHFAAFNVAGMPWTEIDSPGDLDRARQSIWPAIQGWRRRFAGLDDQPWPLPAADAGL